MSGSVQHSTPTLPLTPAQRPGEAAHVTGARTRPAMRGDQTIVQDQAEQQQQDQHVLPAMELTPLVREHALGASGLPSAVSVISGFITAEEERQLLRDGSRTRWTQVRCATVPSPLPP